MNASNAKDYLPLVQALAEGKAIQMLACNGKWEEIEEPSFDCEASRYRIKPEPREIFVVNDDDDLAYFDEGRAKAAACRVYRIVRYREVIE